MIVQNKHMRIRRFVAILSFGVASLGLILTAAAQDYAANSNAQPWGLSGEEKATFSGRIVDVLCELSGDCPANCGDGARYLGILRADDGALIYAVKNGQPNFAGLVADLLPYCNADVDVDGLLVGDQEGVAKLYQVQLIRRGGDSDWSKTNNFTRVWREANPELDGKKGKWFRRDPRITSRIEAEGYLGLGLEADEAYIAENY